MQVKFSIFFHHGNLNVIGDKFLLPDKDPYHNRGRDQMRKKGGPEFECLWITCVVPKLANLLMHSQCALSELKNWNFLFYCSKIAKSENAMLWRMLSRLETCIVYSCTWSVTLAKSIVPRKTWRKLWHHTIIAGGTKWGKRGVRNSSACGLHVSYQN
jgi:hypothetical protein